MKKFEVEFTKSVECKCVIEAESEDEAWEKAEEAALQDDCTEGNVDVLVTDVKEL